MTATTSKVGADMYISENDMARVLFANLFPRGMCPADWDSGAILGPDNIVRRQFLDGAREVLDFIARQPAAIDKDAVGYVMKHKNGADIGFAWKHDDPEFSNDWLRLPVVYAAPLANEASKPAAPKNPEDAPEMWRGDSNAALAWACGWNECLEESKVPTLRDVK